MTKLAKASHFRRFLDGGRMRKDHPLSGIASFCRSRVPFLEPRLRSIRSFHVGSLLATAFGLATVSGHYNVRQNSDEKWILA